MLTGTNTLSARRFTVTSKARDRDTDYRSKQQKTFVLLPKCCANIVLMSRVISFISRDMYYFEDILRVILRYYVTCYCAVFLFSYLASAEVLT